MKSDVGVLIYYLFGLIWVLLVFDVSWWDGRDGRWPLWAVCRHRHAGAGEPATHGVSQGTAWRSALSTGCWSLVITWVRPHTVTGRWWYYVHVQLLFTEVLISVSKNTKVLASAPIFFWIFFCFLAHDSIYDIVRYMLSPVRPSVRPSHGWISQRRLKFGSCNFHHGVAPLL